MIYMLMTDGFEEIEALTPVDVLRRCGADVKTVGVNSMSVRGSHDITLMCDIEFQDIDKQKMDMLILPGGPGHTELKGDKVQKLIRYAADNDIYIAAICAAPSVPGEMGLLSGRKATCYPGFEHELKGADVTGEKVVVDGKFITAKGPGAAGEFAFELAKLMCGSEKVREVKDAMQY